MCTTILASAPPLDCQRSLDQAAASDVGSINIEDMPVRHTTDKQH